MNNMKRKVVQPQTVAIVTVIVQQKKLMSSINTWRLTHIDSKDIKQRENEGAMVLNSTNCSYNNNSTAVGIQNETNNRNQQ